MMRHLFSSGEVMYKKNQKSLMEGMLIGEFLQYGNVESDTEYICVGKLNSRNAQVHFAIAEDDFKDVKTRHGFRILMQSDLLSANWIRYNIKFIE